MNTETPARDILAALDAAGVPKGVIAKKLVIAPSAVTSLYAGTRQLKHDEAVKLLALIPGRPDRAAGKEIPVIGMAGAGHWLEAIEETSKTVWVPTIPYASAKFGVDVVGDSMNLIMPEGSVAIIDPADLSLYVGKIYLLRNAEGEATIKRYRTDPARFEPVSDNASYVPFEVGSTDFKVIGRVTGALQSF